MLISLGDYMMDKNFKEEIAFKIRRILVKENCFLIGFTEIISNNFDFVFRYLYAVAFLLLMAGQYIYQLPPANGYTFMGAALVISVIFLIAFLAVIIIYRKKTSNIATHKAIVFYLKCTCCKTKSVLDNFEQ